MRSLTPIAILALLLVAPAVHAQTPTAPTPVYTLTIQNAPGAFTGLDQPNATATAPFQILLRLGNVVCPQAVTIPVTITTAAAAAPPFFSVRPEPEVLNVTISQGAHGSEPVGQAATGLVDGAARATIAGNVTTNASVQVTVTASAPAPPGCQGAGTVGGATSDPVVIFANLTAPPPPPEPTPAPEDTPFVGFVAVAAVAVAVALARRRRA